MSTLLDRPVETTRLQLADVPVALQPKIRVKPQPHHQPVIERPVGNPAEIPQRVNRRVAKRRSSVNAVRFGLAKGMLFGAFFSVTYVASTLSGHYLVEKSRIQSSAAAVSATAAAQSVGEIQRRLDVLTSASTIEDWAMSHSFRPTDGLGQTSKVVSVVTNPH